MIAQSADSGQSEYNSKGALLYGGAYIAANGSIIWKGLGFSANGPYDAAFALGREGKNVGAHFILQPSIVGDESCCAET